VNNLDENTITGDVLQRIQNTPNPRVKLRSGSEPGETNNRLLMCL